MALQEAADRVEITDVWNRYFRAMDTLLEN